MPSRLPGYPDAAAAARAPYSWPPQQQGVRPPVGPSSSPQTTQQAPYYGYAVAPSGSYDSHHPPYPTAPPPQRSPEDSQGANEQPQQKHAPEERQGSGYGNNPEAPVSQERVGPSASPPSRNNSYDQQQQHDYTRAPESTSYAPPMQHSRSSESAGSTDKPSPPKFPGGAPVFTQAMPHSFVPGYPTGMHNQYGWTHGPPPTYGSAPYPPPPHARRALAPEYAAHPLRRQGSGSDGVTLTPLDEHGRPMSLLRQATSTQVKPRATSPTQIESSRRDEVANMGCTCKKSKCLKLYCMCFGASVVCGPNCRCLVCFNTPDHETERKEAVRAILSRNPAAFDTKFKKNADKTKDPVAGSSADRVLSHKIGCKCRKSQCTKKYCECFNAGIKCSATCRCTGCQNMPPGGFGPDPRFGYSVVPQPYPPAMMPVRNTYVVDEQNASVAAQNLAFMKHSSPNKPDGNPVVAGGIASMPSIVSSDATPTSETEASPQAIKTAQESSKSDGEVANALLMAAYAMTELNAKESPTQPAANDPSGPVLRASPKRKSSDVAPTAENEAVSGRAGGDIAFESPPKPFPDTSAQDDRDTSPATTSESNSMTTPAEQGKSKRSRVGTHKKSALSKKDASMNVDDTPRQEEHPADSDEEPENKSPESKKSKSPSSVEEEEDTSPMTRSRSKNSSPKDVLTPVSARCIDFRRLDVTAEKKKADSDGNEESTGEHMEVAS